MFVVYGHVDLYLPYCSSLKDKRQIIQSIIARIRKRFNISIVEVEYQDLWQRSKLGFSAVASQYVETELIISAVSQILDLHSDEVEITEFTYDTI